MATKKTRVKADKQAKETYFVLDRDYDLAQGEDGYTPTAFNSKSAAIAHIKEVIDSGDGFPPYYIVKVVATTKQTTIVEDIGE